MPECSSAQCPSARAGALSRSPVSLYLLAGRVRDAGFTRCARSSMDRVADFESEGCRFESYRARFRLSPNQPEDRRQVPFLARLVNVRAPVGHFRRSDGNRINPAVSVPSVRQIFGKAFSYGFAIGPRGACRLRACRGLERVWESLHGPHNVVQPGGQWSGLIVHWPGARVRQRSRIRRSRRRPSPRLKTGQSPG